MRSASAKPRVRATPASISILLAPGGGVLAHLAFSPYDLWPLLPVGVAVLLVAVTVRSAWLAALNGFLWGLGLFVPLTQWASIYAGTMPWLALGVVQALYLVVFAVASQIVLSRFGWGLLSTLLIAGAWTATEYLRSSVPWGGLSWGASGFAMAHSPMLAYGPWVGMAGLALVSGLTAALLAAGALALLGRSSSGLQGAAGMLPIALAAVIAVAGIIVPSPRNEPAPQPTLLIAGIQGSAPPVDLGSYTMPEGMLENHLETTADAAAALREENRTADLVVWPEDSTGLDPRLDQKRGDALTHAAHDAGAPVLIGTQTPEGEQHRYNRALLFDAEGYADYSYAKRHPVPFGEYIPLRAQLRHVTDAVDLVTRDMIAGDEVGVMPLHSAARDGYTPRIGILICFEVAYEYLVQDVVDGGAEVIVVQSNTALFGTSHEPAQQLAQAKVMAVISGRSVVHTATSGPSAVFDPQGRVLADVDHFEQGALLADVPLHTGITPAMAVGSWGWIAVSCLALLGVLISLTRPRGAIGADDRVSAAPAPTAHRGGGRG